MAPRSPASRRTGAGLDDLLDSAGRIRGQRRAGRRGQARRRAPRAGRAARRGPPAHRGRPRRRQDDAGQGAGPLDRLLGAAHPVHAGPAAERRHRRLGLRPGAARLRVQAGRGVRQPRRRRRDQPRLAEDPVRAARGDGGAPGHRRRHDVRARDAVHGRSRRRTRSRWRAPTRCPRPSATASPRACRWATRRRPPSSTCSTRHGGADPLDDLEPVADALEVRKLIEVVRAVHVADDVKRYVVDLVGATRQLARPAARRLAARHAAAAAGRPRAGRAGRAATSCCPTTCRRSPARCSPTGCCRPPRPRSPGARPSAVVADLLAARRRVPDGRERRR